MALTRHYSNHTIRASSLTQNLASYGIRMFELPPPPLILTEICYTMLQMNHTDMTVLIMHLYFALNAKKNTKKSVITQSK